MVLLFHFFFLFLFLADDVLPLSSTASGDFPSFFNCGNLGKLSFPLTTPQYQHCGVLQIHGCNDEHTNAEKTLLFGTKKFQVTGIGDTFNTVVFVRDVGLHKSLEKYDCDALCCNIALPLTSPLGSFHRKPHTITFYKCDISLKVRPPKQFLNYTGCGKSNNETILFRIQDQDDPPPSLAKCERVQLPVNMLAFSPDPFTFIASEFSVNIQVSHDCAACIFYDKGILLNNTGGFHCSNSKTEDQNKRWAWKPGSIIGFVVGLGILILALVLCFGLYEQKQSALSNVRFRSMNHYPNNEADPDSGRFYFGVPIFSYMELQHATKNFDPSNKLGDGGLDSVYYGHLIESLSFFPYTIVVFLVKFGTLSYFIYREASRWK